jgi:predicted phosphodiesterase
MRYGIFSDVHSNLEAFNAASDYFKKERIDKYIFLGDIVGYGANPRECIHCLKNLNPLCIAGNHDWAVIDKLGIEYFNEYAAEAIIWTKKELSLEDIGYLQSFKLTYEEADFICAHGSLEEAAGFKYILGINDALRNFSLLKQRLLFIGHSHRAEIYAYRAGEATYVLDAEIKLKKESKYIINVGSVGQPRDRDPRACVCIYDSDEDIVILERFAYNIQKTADKILDKRLPPLFASRLYIGC